MDFNRSTNHTLLLHDFIESRGLVLDVLLKEYNVDFTYHFDNRRFSILDHFIISAQLAPSHSVSVSIDHSVDNTSDHEPITIALPLKVGHYFVAHVDRKPAWHKCSEKHLNQYRTVLSSYLRDVDAVNALVVPIYDAKIPPIPRC